MEKKLEAKSVAKETAPLEEPEAPEVPKAPDKKPELIVPCAEDLVEVINSDESPNDLEVKTSSEPNWVTTAENSPRRASERAY